MAGSHIAPRDDGADCSGAFAEKRFGAPRPQPQTRFGTRHLSLLRCLSTWMLRVRRRAPSHGGGLSQWQQRCPHLRPPGACVENVIGIAFGLNPGAVEQPTATKRMHTCAWALQTTSPGSVHRQHSATIGPKRVARPAIASDSKQSIPHSRGRTSPPPMTEPPDTAKVLVAVHAPEPSTVLLSAALLKLICLWGHV